MLKPTPNSPETYAYTDRKLSRKRALTAPAYDPEPVAHPAPYVILAAIQFDGTGTIALQEAVCIARRALGAKLHLLHIATPSRFEAPNGISTSIESQLARAPDKLRRYIERACADMTIEVVGHIRSGVPAKLILQTAASLGADVVVLGTHKRRGLDKLLLGSVAEQVLQHALCPVLIATPKAYDAVAPDPPCNECVALRDTTHLADSWCERHSRATLRPHVYSPST